MNFRGFFGSITKRLLHSPKDSYSYIFQSAIPTGNNHNRVHAYVHLSHTCRHSKTGAARKTEEIFWRRNCCSFQANSHHEATGLPLSQRFNTCKYIFLQQMNTRSWVFFFLFFFFSWSKTRFYLKRYVAGGNINISETKIVRIQVWLARGNWTWKKKEMLQLTACSHTRFVTTQTHSLTQQLHLADHENEDTCQRRGRTVLLRSLMIKMTDALISVMVQKQAVVCST